MRRRRIWNYRFWSFFYGWLSIMLFLSGCLTIWRTAMEKYAAQDEVTLLKKKLNQAQAEVVEVVSTEPYEVGLNAFKAAMYDEKNERMGEIMNAIYINAMRTRVSPFLGYRVMMQESGGDPAAISNTGDYGLMQVNYAVHWRSLKIDFGRILEIPYNVNLGMTILADCMRRANGDAETALRMYNGVGKGGDPNYQANVIGGTHD